MKENNMLRKIKYFVSAVFSNDSTAKCPLPPNNFFFNVLKNISRSREKT
jgi:hypothetical protein